MTGEKYDIMIMSSEYEVSDVAICCRTCSEMAPRGVDQVWTHCVHLRVY